MIFITRQKARERADTLKDSGVTRWHPEGRDVVGLQSSRSWAAPEVTGRPVRPRKRDRKGPVNPVCDA